MLSSGQSGWTGFRALFFQLVRRGGSMHWPPSCSLCGQERGVRRITVSSQGSPGFAWSTLTLGYLLNLSKP